MNLSHKDLLDLLRKISVRNAPSNTPCPSSMELVASFAPSATKRLKTKIVDHISGCPECREAFELLITIMEHDKQTQHRSSTEEHYSRFLKRTFHYQSPHMFSARVPSLIIGCLMIAVSILVMTQRNHVSPQSREENTNIILEYPTVSLDITDKAVFRWAPYVPAGYYILELFDEALLPVWTSGRTEVPQVQISEEARSMLQPGKAYFWMVTAYSGADDIKESNLIRFVVTDD
jgi:hypothetical protein